MSANDRQDVETDETARLTEGIEQTRAKMSGALSALENRLSPAEVRGKLDGELQHVEEKVREVVREHLAEAKSLVKEELAEAQTFLRQEMNAAEAKIKTGLGEARDTVKKDLAAQLESAESKIRQGLSDAKQSVKQDLHEVVTGAKKSVRAATLGKVEDLATTIGDSMNDTRDTLVDTIRQNPIPAAIAGIGLAWLFMNRSSSAKRGRAGANFVDNRGMPYTYDAQTGARSYGDGLGRVVTGMQRSVGHAVDNLGNAVHGATDAAGNALHQASDAAGSMAQQISTGASSALHGAADLAGRAASQTSDAASALVHGIGDASSSFAHGASDAASQMADGALDQVRRAERGFQDTLQENPLAIGAAAVALGAVIGFALPRTAKEDALMGEARDGLLHQAEGAAHDAAAALGKLTEQAGANAKGLLSGKGEAAASS